MKVLLAGYNIDSEIIEELKKKSPHRISRLREDATSQWEIRNLARRMSELASEVMPLTFLLLGGKDVYPECFKQQFGEYPKSSPA